SSHLMFYSIVYLFYLGNSNVVIIIIFFFSSRRRHTRSKRDWSSDVCSSDLVIEFAGHSARKRHGPGRTVFIDLDIEATRQRIDDRRTDTVQTAGRVVRSAAALSAGMRFGEHHIHARQTGPRLGVDRDSAPGLTNF